MTICDYFISALNSILSYLPQLAVTIIGVYIAFRLSKYNDDRKHEMQLKNKSIFIRTLAEDFINAWGEQKQISKEYAQSLNTPFVFHRLSITENNEDIKTFKQIGNKELFECYSYIYNSEDKIKSFHKVIQSINKISQFNQEILDYSTQDFNYFHTEYYKIQDEINNLFSICLRLLQSDTLSKIDSQFIMPFQRKEILFLTEHNRSLDYFENEILNPIMNLWIPERDLNKDGKLDKVKNSSFTINDMIFKLKNHYSINSSIILSKVQSTVESEELIRSFINAIKNKNEESK